MQVITSRQDAGAPVIDIFPFPFLPSALVTKHMPPFSDSNHSWRPGPAWSRRSFISATTSAAAALLFQGKSRSSALAAENKWRMRLSTSSIHFKDLPIEQAVQRIAALGFEGIDIWSAYENCRHLDDAAKRLGPQGLQELLAKNKIELYSFSTYVGGYARYAELLGKAGGGVAVQGSSAPCPPEELTGKMRLFLEKLKPLIELAEKHNSYLAIENHGHALLNTIDSFKAFVDLNKSKRLGIALAPYHLQSIEASVEDAIAISGEQLFFFYAWQNRPEMDQLPGHGPTDFAPWLRALARINYRWYVNPFMHGHPPAEEMSAALAKSRSYLRKTAAEALIAQG
jgi:sugar phosphate isomerase/epimerase